MHSLRGYDPYKTKWEQYYDQGVNTVKQSSFFIAAGAIAEVALKSYAAPIIGLAGGFFALRFLFNTFLPSDHKIVQRIKQFEQDYPWVVWIFFIITLGYFAPKYADKKLAKNPTFWGGAAFGGYLGTTFTTKTQKK